MSSSSQQVTNSRTIKLRGFFQDVISGKTILKNIQNGNLFLEALCNQEDPPTCIEKILSSTHGLQAVQTSTRFSSSPAFLNDQVTVFLQYIQASALKVIYGGDFLQELISNMVEPPIFWNALVGCFRNRTLSVNAQQSFAWLLLELISSPLKTCNVHSETAWDSSIQELLMDSSELEIRTLGQKIKHALSTFKSEATTIVGSGPGGRHDNDLVDFREIAILPTADELLSTDEPFLRCAATVEDLGADESHLQSHLDNQFRLLREDMLSEMREEMSIVQRKKPGRHKGIMIKDLKILNVNCGPPTKRQGWRLQLQCKSDLGQLSGIKPSERKQYLITNRNLLKHQSLACLMVDGDVAAFAAIHRDIDMLASTPPIVDLQLYGQSSTSSALLKLKTAKTISLAQLDTALFSFEPILKGLQGLRNLALVNELIFWKNGESTIQPPNPPLKMIERIETDPHRELQGLLGTSQSVRLDKSQALSLLTGLKQRVSLIQGPPGTGKSFIGALISKILFDSTSKTILVVCFTNHALDQFLEDLLDIGIPADSMVRLGGKSTPRTKPLALFDQSFSYKTSQETRKLIDNLKAKQNELADQLHDAFAVYLSANVSKAMLMEYLEFLSDGPPFHEAFKLPRDQDKMVRVGKRGKAVDEFYLLERWCNGVDNAGTFQDSIPKSSQELWHMSAPDRHANIATWKLNILKDQISSFCDISQKYNDYQGRLDKLLKRKHSQIIGSKRIIGCTTTAAAKYSQELQAASRDVLLVEEAGEILESHILTALDTETEQLILIGDHKQLRPKVNSHRLSVEKGEGFDLNRSLFERLVLKGYPHQTLMQQHRMRPEISSLVRALTYPDLVDAPRTRGRDNLRGFQDNVIFLDHSHLEDNNSEIENSKDTSSFSSKRNTFEAEMVMQCVRYLAQQGYGTDRMVVLTPYLGQLQLLQKLLSETNDPILNDPDSYDLIRAGLLPVARAKPCRNPIHLSTIDNYQGEESNIVIASLTRSNTSHQIGFLSSPERLNVILSRARDAIILIGNAKTFLGARIGNNVWKRFLDLLKQRGHVYDGFPVKCERHPDRKSILHEVADFDSDCPDGGCKEPWQVIIGTMLPCGIHKCPQRCHQLFDHSQVKCQSVLKNQCPKGHVKFWKCHEGGPLSCHRCESDANDLRIKQQKAQDDQERRDRAEREHAKQMAQLDAELEVKRRIQRDAQLAKERDLAIQQKKSDIAAATESIFVKMKNALFSTDPVHSRSNTDHNQSAHNSKPKNPIPIVPTCTRKESAAKKDWQHQKDVQGAKNDAIDAIMEMIGLEDVKSQILRIKDKIDVGIRQNTISKGERYNVVFQGNPGTAGKTTVARHYAKALASLGALPGSAFVETTGSRLASDGIAGIKKHIEEIKNAGGGAMFLDEAYQLTNDHNYGGRQVLDFLLAEMENHVGEIVFILAGYNKEMEKFFEHNPGLLSRVPYCLQFTDYDDDELLLMMRQLISKKYEGKMRIDGDEAEQESLYLRVAARRLGRGRGRSGFGNARALQTIFSRISERQAERLNRERRNGLSPDDFFLSKEDLIGPDPSLAIVQSTAWARLQEMIGLSSVKESIQSMIDRIQVNYKRELLEKTPIEVSLNRVFLGHPGTGKTSVAKLYGKILADLGLLSNGEVVVKNPADFVGNVLGQSESNTKAILATTIGKVLIIDEAYMLYSGNEGGGNSSDSYKTAVIDTIVAEVQSVPGEDRCVLLLGYKDQIETMFQNVNPGLSRRFAIDSAFHFEDFSDEELRKILELKLKQQDLGATKEAKDVAIEVLSRARNRPNFGNAGEVENIISNAKNRQQARQSKSLSANSFDVIFEPVDFDENFDRGNHATTNLKKLFEDVIGCEDVVAKLEAYQQTSQNLKRRNRSYRDLIPTNFLFKGPPGTGKTTTARKMGQVFYDMGFLTAVEVVECSASDLIGQYVGQTGPKTRAQLDKALGKVLFVDEAYRLSEGSFANEAINELVDSLTKAKYKGKMIVILAGYADQINQLISVNPGLSSRFAEEIIFKNMSPKSCLRLLESTIAKQDIGMPHLGDAQTELHVEMIDLMNQLASLPSWGNARDIISLGNAIAGSILSAESNPSEPLIASQENILNHTKVLLVQKQGRCANLPLTKPHDIPSQMTQSREIEPHLTPKSSKTSTAIQSTKKPESKKPAHSTVTSRDPGVPEEVWKQLQADKAAAERVSLSSKQAIKTQEQDYKAKARKASQALTRSRNAQEQEIAGKKQEELAAIQRQRVQARLEEHNAQNAAKKARAELDRLRRVEETRKRHEAQVQTRLQQIGHCVAGFQWIRQSGGYRCAGGSHFVTDGELAM
ncbi:hypothetical protein MMC07_001120 [Pseudocyphellaria aurata]|nr:hypothetical protein [Pseudocyphellaria aurata]